jgi:hypothetical protein
MIPMEMANDPISLEMYRVACSSTREWVLKKYDMSSPEFPLAADAVEAANIGLELIDLIRSLYCSSHGDWIEDMVDQHFAEVNQNATERKARALKEKAG